MDQLEEVRIPIQIYLTPQAVKQIDEIVRSLNRQSRKLRHNRGTVVREILQKAGIKG